MQRPEESTPDGRAIQEMLAMASRLRSAGGTLDDASILAVAEMAGVDPEIIRMHAQLAMHSPKASLFDRMKSSFLAFDPKIRNYVAGAWLGLAAG
ncbi:hypothetical protein CCB81_02710 [Armatimonadetes bacterium Uphvl-Ar2]|nr:hypothetical protein CCB81_02710 [Armatimonadetes bacterium Uphvl-Ar2]